MLCLPEVYAPYLLKKKAIMLRKQTGDSRYHHPHEQIKINFNTIFTKHLARPGRMIILEPIVTFVAFYASFSFSVLYGILEVFPIAFRDRRGWPLFVSSLPFVSLFVGVLLAVLINLGNEPRYRRISAAAGGKPVPEGRLLPMSFGGIIFVCGLFWFGWTTVSVFWLSPIIAIALIGAGFTVINNASTTLSTPTDFTPLAQFLLTLC
jgi:hypothetical protein